MNGEGLSGSAKLPERRIFEGSDVRIEPISPEEHGDALWKRSSGPDNLDLWAFLADGPFENRAAFDAYLKKRESADDPLLYAIINRQSNQAVGYAALMRMEPVHQVIEIGNILFTKDLQKTRGATEALYLLTRYAFEELGNRRYEWKCNALNYPSRSAALRLGFTFEGIFRQHMIQRGKNRDTAWFSMLDSEWPARKAEMERWLDPANFDENGNQRTRLQRHAP